MPDTPKTDCSRSRHDQRRSPRPHQQRAGTWTTRELAAEFGCKEYRARAVVAWLCIGGHVRIADVVTRRDVRGRPYQAQVYTWTGRTAPVARVVRDPDRRRENWAPLPATAQEWLSRAWV